MKAVENISACAIALSLSLGTTSVAAQREAPSFSELDQNQNAQVSAQEASAWQPLDASFDKVDVDSSGFVDEAEFASFKEIIDEMAKEVPK